MSTNSYWLSYDARYDRRQPRRKWPWVLLLAALLTAVAFAGRDAVSIDLAEPVTIQEALPALLVDNVTVVYVVDDSNSMLPRNCCRSTRPSMKWLTSTPRTAS